MLKGKGMSKGKTRGGRRECCSLLPHVLQGIQMSWNPLCGRTGKGMKEIFCYQKLSLFWWYLQECGGRVKIHLSAMAEAQTICTSTGTP